MMKRVLRIILLVIVFLVAVTVFFFMLNRDAEESTEDAGTASLPVIYMQLGEEWINEMHGYRQEMSPVSMRDNILPMPEDGVLSLRIDTDEEVRSLSYEIRSLDGITVVSEGDGKVTANQQGSCLADVSLTDNLGQGADYILCLHLQTKEPEQDLWYYSRLAKFTAAHVPECLAFAEQLHEITRDATRSNELTGTMEPEAGEEEGNLQKVTIHSSLKQICWADFSCEEVTEPSVSIKEITNSYSVYVMEYMVRHDADDAEEYYNVREYYRVRYGEQKLYLLDFERTISRIYTGTANAGDDYLNLGIRTSDVDYSANQTGTVVCFVQEGELWSWQSVQNRMVRVFGFDPQPGSETAAGSSAKDKSPENESGENGGTENGKAALQNWYPEHEIRTIRVDENGSIDFIVFGYMNSGWHAGEVGISVCHYDSVADQVQELLFLPQQASYQQLKENVGRLMYVSDNGTFYFSAGTDLYRIDPAGGKPEIVYSGVRSNLKISANGRYVAWTESKEGKYAAVLHVTDLETEETLDVKAGEDECLQPLGFLGTDLLFGTAEKKAVKQGSSQNVFPMKSVSIADISNAARVLKTYDAKDRLFSSVEISSEGSITLSCVRAHGSTYVKAEPFSIKNNELLTTDHAGVIFLDSAEKQTEIGLQLGTQVGEDVQLEEPSLAGLGDAVTLYLPDDLFASNYYVYAKGKVIKGTSDVAAAVRSADANGGVVVDASQHYIWNRAKMLSQNKIKLQEAGGKSNEAKALNVMLAAMGAPAEDTDSLLQSGKNAFEILEEQQKDGLMLNLSGCTLEQILYYIGRGYPAYALGKDGKPVLLYGYDSSKVLIFDPENGKTSEQKLDAASQMFDAEGSVFYVYQKQL